MSEQVCKLIIIQKYTAFQKKASGQCPSDTSPGFHVVFNDLKTEEASMVVTKSKYKNIVFTIHEISALH